MTERASRSQRRSANTYLRVAAKAERRGVRKHRRELLAGLSRAVCHLEPGPGLSLAHYSGSRSAIAVIETGAAH